MVHTSGCGPLVRCRPIVVQQKRHRNQISNTAPKQLSQRKVEVLAKKRSWEELSKSTAKKYILPEQTASHQKAETKILWQKLSQRAENLSIVRPFVRAGCGGGGGGGGIKTFLFLGFCVAKFVPTSDLTEDFGADNG